MGSTIKDFVFIVNPWLNDSQEVVHLIKKVDIK
jgi:hypothetical protein